MKRIIFLMCAVLLFAGIASAQTTLDLKGTFRVYPEINNYGYGAGLGATTSYPKHGTDAGFVDQRMRLFFNVKSGDNVGGTYALEIDSRWGGTSYTSGRAADGGGFESDTVNAETKNVFLWFKPAADTKVTAGIQGFTDDFQGIIFGGSDMAGFRLDQKLSADSDLLLGWYLLWDPNAARTDSVYFVPLTFKQKMGNNTLGLSFYTIQDNSNYQSFTDDNAATTGVATQRTTRTNNTGYRPLMYYHDENLATDDGDWYAAYDRAQLYYAGANFSGKADNTSYTLFFVYNWGVFKDVNKATSGAVAPTGTVRNDYKVNAFAVSGEVVTAVADTSKVKIRGLWASGDDKTHGYNGMVTGNQYATGADMPLMQDDLFLLVRTVNDLNHSKGYLPDVQNQGYGCGLIYGSFIQTINDKTNVQFTVGHLRSATERPNYQNEMATEGNVKLTYNIDKTMAVSGIAAIADTDDFYDEYASNRDNAYRLLARFIYNF